MTIARQEAGKPVLRGPNQTVAQDWESLARYFAGKGAILRVTPPPGQFAGGFANLNFLLSFDPVPADGPFAGAAHAVLRRPPPGPLVPGANDMGREARILKRMNEAFPLAPRALHLCEDEAVIGAPFLVSEYRPGAIIAGTLPAWFPDGTERETSCATLAGHLVETLATLHRVDPAAVELDRLGRPEGFVARTVEGWARRASNAWEREDGLLKEIPDWMRGHAPPDTRPTLLHNDFKLDNMMIDPVGLAPVAVLDWDLGTRGHPLLDLAVMLAYWTEAGDPDAMLNLGQMPTAEPGFGGRQAAAEAYAARTGWDLSDFAFFRVLGAFRMAVIFRQLHNRWRDGSTADPKYRDFGPLADGLLDFTAEIMRGRCF